MTARARAAALIIPLAVFVAGQAPAEDDVTLLRDLTAVIMLLGLPCGQVVNATLQADNDHIATCTDGTRYRVYVNAEGRVVAEQQVPEKDGPS